MNPCLRLGVGRNGQQRYSAVARSRFTTRVTGKLSSIGQWQLLDVAVRFDNEADCYGWNNDSYLYNWRNPNWKLPRERYLAKVTITSSGQKCIGVFRLVNDVEQLADFRLDPARAGDQEKVL